MPIAILLLQHIGDNSHLRIGGERWYKGTDLMIEMLL